MRPRRPEEVSVLAKAHHKEQIKEVEVEVVSRDIRETILLLEDNIVMDTTDLLFRGVTQVSLSSHEEHFISFLLKTRCWSC